MGVRDFRKEIKRDTDMGKLKIRLGDKLLHCDHGSLEDVVGSKTGKVGIDPDW